MNRFLTEGENEMLFEALTRKHFQAAADILKAHKAHHPEMHRMMAHAFADHFKGENAAFDRNKFLKAAGVDEK